MLNFNINRRSFIAFAALVLWSVLVLAAGDDSDIESAYNDTAAPQFDIWEIRVSGNSLLENRVIEGVVYPHLGPDKNIDTVEAAREQLESAYHAAGYGTVLVNIPEQDVVGGIVYLEVMEGQIERLRISGSRYFALGKIRQALPSLKEGQTPYVPAVQEEIQKLNAASADRKVTPILKPGRSAGMTDVELAVEDVLPVHGNLQLNGRNTRDTTRSRLGGGLRYTNLWQAGHTIGMQFQLTPEAPDETTVFSGSYLFPIPNSEALVALYGVVTDSDVFAGSDINVIGAGNIYGARVIVPLAPLEWGYHRASFGLDYKDFDESVGLLGSDSFTTPITYHLFEAGYTLNRLGETSDTEFSFAVNFAFRNLGNTLKEFENKRFLAKPNFAYLSASFDHTQYFRNRGHVRLAFDGQIAESPLISNEQFSAGGIESVRGYVESQHLTDHGIRGSLEYHTPSIASLVWSGLSDLHGVVFVDGAYLKVMDALPNQFPSFTLFGAGLGVHFDILARLRGRIYTAWALRQSVGIERGDSRIHFDFDYAF